MEITLEKITTLEQLFFALNDSEVVVLNPTENYSAFIAHYVQRTTGNIIFHDREILSKTISILEDQRRIYNFDSVLHYTLYNLIKEIKENRMYKLSRQVLIDNHISLKLN